MPWWRRARPAVEETPTLEERLAAVMPGVPGRCPACDGLGYIDSTDIGHRYQIQHCKDCGHRWEYLFDDDGALVGLTELDEAGQPVARTRIRPLRAHADPTDEPEAASADEGGAEPDEPVPPDDEDPDAPPLTDEARVIDLRPTEPPSGPASDDDAEAPEPDGSTPEEMSPAQWLRHSLRR